MPRFTIHSMKRLTYSTIRIQLAGTTIPTTAGTFLPIDVTITAPTIRPRAMEWKWTLRSGLKMLRKRVRSWGSNRGTS